METKIRLSAVCRLERNQGRMGDQVEAESPREIQECAQEAKSEELETGVTEKKTILKMRGRCEIKMPRSSNCLNKKRTKAAVAQFRSGQSSTTSDRVQYCQSIPRRQTPRFRTKTKDNLFARY
jgi:hypothetical protein